MAIRDISDTALWAALYRAMESERPNAFFRDPYARRLAGERGEQIYRTFPKKSRNDWAWVTRTVLFDQFITEQIAAGADMVINLAAGLDARPYRMSLPPSLQWIEVDLPPLVDYKEEILRGEKPVCRVERVRLDLADVAARRELFARLGTRARNALIITEGLLIYLTTEEVATLAADLASVPSFRHWILDIASPGLLRMLQKQIGGELSQAGAPLKFAPPEGPPFFERSGWRVKDVRSTLKTAARLRRVGLLFRFFALMPESQGAQGSRPWSAACLLER